MLSQALPNSVLVSLHLIYWLFPACTALMKVLLSKKMPQKYQRKEDDKQIYVYNMPGSRKAEWVLFSGWTHSNIIYRYYIYTVY